jgi:Zn-dependent protease with chaperone function
VDLGPRNPTRLLLALGLSLLSIPLFSQQNPAEVPENFTLDQQTAARLRPQLLLQSRPVFGRYEIGRQVFERLIAQTHRPKNLQLSWELRLVDDSLLNAFASPDGTIFVNRGLADLAGSSAGLWAAILSHEIAHVVRRDWARRYLYEKSLETGSTLVLGDPALAAATWTDSSTASASLAQFCRQMEIDADLAALMLMAHAGYHPDFAAALHHLLHSRSTDSAATTSLYAMHPCWEQRDRELQRAYLAASIEFEHLWPDWYASPGGNPPVVVFEEYPRIKKSSGNHWVIQVPIRCENLAGVVEVVLRTRSSQAAAPATGIAEKASPSGSSPEVRQLTGCTSPTTTVTFPLDASSGKKGPYQPWTDAYVLDTWGTVLSRADIPKLHR